MLLLGGTWKTPPCAKKWHQLLVAPEQQVPKHRSWSTTRRAHSKPRSMLLRYAVLGLLVFGPHRKRYSKLRFRFDARRLQRNAGCLVWPLE